MQTGDILTVCLGLESPWKIVGQHLATDCTPYRLDLEIGSERGAMYPCPECGKLCKAHDFKEMNWRHMNIFQHHCYLTARVPRIDCPEHGIRRVEVPWARKGSGFTLLFERMAMLLVREMPVSAVAKIVAVTDTRLWRIVRHYVEQSLKELDLSSLYGIGLDETASKRGHNYVTVFVDMDRESRPVIFATPGKGKECFERFLHFLKKHGGNPEQVAEVVCDMSPAFLSASEKYFPYACRTVDWFHVVQLFTHAMEEVRKAEAREKRLPKGTRWTTLKGIEASRSNEQEEALKELLACGLATSTAFRIKEMLRWIRWADTRRAAKWRITRFVNTARELMAGEKLLIPVEKALQTFEIHKERILRRWNSLLTNARLEGLNGLFQAARARARGYRNTANFIAMIYMIAAPVNIIVSDQIPH